MLLKYKLWNTLNQRYFNSKWTRRPGMSNKSVDDLIGTLKKDFNAIQTDHPVYSSLIQEHCFRVLLNSTAPDLTLDVGDKFFLIFAILSGVKSNIYSWV